MNPTAAELTDATVARPRAAVATAVAPGAERTPAPAIDARRPTPLYHQIFLLLRDGIYRGEYELGSFLPGEQELATLHGVSRITAKRALDDIAAAGLAVREQGRGTRVCIRPRGISVRGSVDGLVHSLHAKGSSSVKLLGFDYVGATPLVAERLQIAIGDSVQNATRIWHGDAGPFNHLSTFVPAALGRQWTREDLEHRTLVSLLQSTGVTISRAEENITATLADDAVAAALDVAPGSALLKITRTVYGEQDRPVEFLVALYPPDRYRYTVSLGGNADRSADHGADPEPQPAP